MNKSIDTIQDGFFEYGIVAGVVFDRVFAKKVSTETKENSKLRELCIAANVLYLDRGCGVVRRRHVEMSNDCPGYLEYMLNWIAKNFHLMGKCADNPYNCQNPRDGFNILNRKSTCTCHFHVHDNPNRAHYNHENCLNRIRSCQCRCDGE
ncbi:hypothetical protein BJ875DRAFT_368797 [Amylocarpus encephaloides]|uniref:Uncharacterized protein n=1 Tax=Amylocarpus encephaloides TaxID=45428 RepID=A0A9P7YRX1_9HELO|nr:hypothetical protein BJ875DRAFT_368797 [Amylocarpus encephaloides]